MTGAVQTRVDDGVIDFSLVELDLLATHAGVPCPFPLRVPSFGRIPGERDVLLAAAARTLELRDLADETGPRNAAAEVVTALREHRGTVDLVLTTADGPVGVVALVYRSWALICRQALDDEASGTVRIRRLADTALTGELLGLVPELPAVRSMPITLPAREVIAATRVITEVEDPAERARLLRDAVRDPGVLDRLTGLFPVLTGHGQLGATRRTGDRTVRAGAELSWLDGPKGRVRLDRGDNGWVSVNPLRHNDIRHALDNLATLARKPR
jgi:hypothetical protein